jgi:hemerythrin-like domain-containing protein
LQVVARPAHDCRIVEEPAMYEITRFMNREHARLAMLFREYQAARRYSTPDARRLLGQFVTSQERHMMLEEEFLFPLFEKHAKPGNSGATTVMRTEHLEIRDAMAELQRAHAGGEAERILLDSLRAHEVMEDRVFTPWVDETLNERDRIALFEQLRDSRAAAPQVTHD